MDSTKLAKLALILSALSSAVVVGGAVLAVWGWIGDWFDERVAAIVRSGGGVVIAIPSSAVVAFDSDECPAGWRAEPRAAGRFIVGTGAHSEFNSYGNSVAVKSLGQVGGEDQVRLILDNLPSHFHHTRRGAAVRKVASPHCGLLMMDIAVATLTTGMVDQPRQPARACPTTTCLPTLS